MKRSLLFGKLTIGRTKVAIRTFVQTFQTGNIFHYARSLRKAFLEISLAFGRAENKRFYIFQGWGEKILAGKR